MAFLLLRRIATPFQYFYKLMTIFRSYMLVLILLLQSLEVLAADSLNVIRIVPVKARMIAMDELGNTYVVRADNVLIRYDNKGDSTGFYRGVLNGDIGAIDATNPLRILLYYPAYSKVVMLDRMLSEKAVVDLRRQNILSATAVATSSDGKLWVYDPFNAKLMKLDESGEVMRSSIDLRQQVGFVPTPNFLLERDRRIYVSDLAKGILVFDQFANYITILPLKSIERFQAFDQQLVYRLGNVLHSYDLKIFADKELNLPVTESPVKDACIGPNTLSVLYEDHMAIYESPL